MYTREINGQEIELHNTGKLHKDALVMFDRETGTLWRQADGLAMDGSLAGHQLAEVPALQTTWKCWKKLHPKTLVLSKPSDIRGSTYASYFVDPTRLGLSGTRGDARLAGKALVLGVHVGNDAMAVALLTLRKRQLVEIELGGEPILAFYSTEEKTPVVLRAAVEGRRLTFRLRTEDAQVVLEDQQTHSRWAPLQGRALAGPLQGKQLEPIPYVLAYWYAWSSYRPQTRLIR